MKRKISPMWDLSPADFRIETKNPRSAMRPRVLFLCPRQESNLRPLGPQPSALSTELRGHGYLMAERSLKKENFPSNGQESSSKYAGISPKCQPGLGHEALRERISGASGG